MLDKPVVRASDLMEKDVITVRPETRVLDLNRLFVENELYGAPVVDDQGVVQGVVSTLDLLRILRDEVDAGAGSKDTTYFRDELPYSGPDWVRMPEDLQDRLQAVTAADAMTRELVMVRPDATLDEVARTMSRQRVHRVLVGEGRSLQGVITALELLPALSRVLQPNVGQVRSTGYHRGNVK